LGKYYVSRISKQTEDLTGLPSAQLLPLVQAIQPTNGAQDLHENLLLIGDAAFPGLSNQNELN